MTGVVLALFSSGTPVFAEELEGRVGYSIGLVAPAGVYAYVPDKWGILHVHLNNPLDRPVEVLAATYFDDEPTLQYGRRIWLPARSRVQSWHPVRLPSIPQDGRRNFDFRTLVMEAGKGREVLIRSNAGTLQLDGTLRVTEETPVTGMVDALGDEHGRPDSPAYELVVAGRVGAQLRRQISQLSDRILPAGEESLNALDQLVISDSRILGDAAGIAAARRWLYGGGHLWVMLDLVDPRILELLMGDDLVFEVVDRVGLTTVSVEAGPLLPGLGRQVNDYEQPVELVRTLVSDVDVMHTVNGWPVAFTKTCGDGKLFVTTMSAHGWMRLRTPQDPVPTLRNVALAAQESPVGGRPGQAPQQPRNATTYRDPSSLGRHVPLEPMAQFAAEFFGARPAPLLPAQRLETRVQEYVGYSVTPRWLVFSVLIGFSVSLAGAGAFLWKGGRLELLGAIGPAVALVAGVGLVYAGRYQRQSIPATFASVQYVQPVAGTDEVRIEGSAALYSADAGEAEISGTQGGLLLPEMSGLEGNTRRMVWTDIDRWQWENLSQTAGSRPATLVSTETVPGRLRARATFGPRGLTGVLAAPAGQRPADALVATREGRMGVQFGADGSFEARSDAVFAPGQYLAADLLSDEQNRRRDLLEELFENEERLDFPSQPRLMYWTDPWSGGFELPQDRARLGAALVSVPLELERPSAGTNVMIPAPLLGYRAMTGPDGQVPSGMWDNRRREWQEKSAPSATWLRIQVPRVLLPLDIERLRFRVQVTGPVGKLEIAGHRGVEAVALKQYVDPVGENTFEVADVSALPIDAEGGLMIRVSAGDPDRPELTRTKTDDGVKVNYWRLVSLSLEMQAKTVDPPADVNEPEPNDN